MNINPLKKRYYTLPLILLLIATILLSGCQVPVSEHNSPTESPSSPERQLCFSATPDPDAGFRLVNTEDMNGCFSHGLTYLNLKDVTIEWNDESISLENALANAYITEEEILCYARLDARNGFCSESVISTHGLTHFTFHYPEVDLRVIYDVFEAPDGRQHLISDIGIYCPGEAPRTYFDFTDNKTGLLIGRENWGLSFEVVEATPTTVTLKCTQSQGQQIGELRTDFYNLYNSESNFETMVPVLNGVEYLSQFQPAVTIPADTEFIFTLDWEDTFGVLAAGTYGLDLYIIDVYDESEVHPLMENFYDRQNYWIEFTIE